MSTLCQIPVTATEGIRLEMLLKYSREYAQRGYPGMDEPIIPIATALLKNEDLVLVASSAGRPKHRGAYAYLQLTGNVEGIALIHRLYQLLMATLMGDREYALASAAPYYRQISSVSLSHSFKVYPNKLHLHAHYQAFIIKAPAETEEQQALYCQALLTAVKLL